MCPSPLRAFDEMSDVTSSASVDEEGLQRGEHELNDILYHKSHEQVKHHSIKHDRRDKAGRKYPIRWSEEEYETLLRLFERHQSKWALILEDEDAHILKRNKRSPETLRDKLRQHKMKLER